MKSNSGNYIQRLKNGKEDALEFIMDEYFPLVKGVVSQVLRPAENREMAEECISDVFLSLWNNAKKFRGENENDFRKWIYAIAKYKAIDYYRRKMKQAEIPLFEGELAGPFLAEESVEEQALFNESAKEMEKMLNVLAPIDRSILIMKFFWGMTSEEISEKLGMSKSVVNNRIYRGKKHLVNGITELEIGGL